MNIATETFYDIRELAGLLRVKTRTVRNWLRRDALPYVKVGGSVRFAKSEIDLWIEERRRTRLPQHKSYP